MFNHNKMLYRGRIGFRTEGKRVYHSDFETEGRRKRKKDNKKKDQNWKEDKKKAEKSKQ